VSAARYVRYAPGIQVVLARDVVFSFFISVIPALLPVVGLRVLNLDSRGLGYLYTSMGVGSVVGAVFCHSSGSCPVVGKYADDRR